MLLIWVKTAGPSQRPGMKRTVGFVDLAISEVLSFSRR